MVRVLVLLSAGAKAILRFACVAWMTNHYGTMMMMMMMMMMLLLLLFATAMMATLISCIFFVWVLSLIVIVTPCDSMFPMDCRILSSRCNGQVKVLRKSLHLSTFPHQNRVPRDSHQIFSEGGL